MTVIVKQDPVAALPRGWKASDSPVKRAFAKSRLVQLACGTLLLIVLATIFAPLLAWQNPFDPASLDLMDAFTPPWSHGLGDAFYPLGADDQGRDLFSAILYGLRMSVFVGVSAVALSLVIGVPLGLIAGYAGGWFDTLLMRIAD
ncbi:MAG: ABC transporter permease, partial [Pseudomonas sp.]